MEFVRHDVTELNGCLTKCHHPSTLGVSGCPIMHGYDRRRRAALHFRISPSPFLSDCTAAQRESSILRKAFLPSFLPPPFVHNGAQKYHLLSGWRRREEFNVGFCKGIQRNNLADEGMHFITTFKAHETGQDLCSRNWVSCNQELCGH